MHYMQLRPGPYIGLAMEGGLRRQGVTQALSTKLKLKLAALKALPEELRAHAMVEDLTPPPLTRRMPTLTPPVPEYKNARQSTISTPGRRIGTNR